MYVQSKVRTQRGRCEALAQGKTRRNLTLYKSLGKELVAVGVNFSTATKSVESWEVAVINE